MPTPTVLARQHDDGEVEPALAILVGAELPEDVEAAEPGRDRSSTISDGAAASIASLADDPLSTPTLLS